MRVGWSAQAAGEVVGLAGGWVVGLAGKPGGRAPKLRSWSERGSGAGEEDLQGRRCAVDVQAACLRARVVRQCGCEGSFESMGTQGPDRL